MALDELFDELCQSGISVQRDVPLAKYTTFQIGGNCDLLVKPTSITELDYIMELLIKEKVPHFILGNGSNLLVSDAGYRGVIVLMTGLTAIEKISENQIACSAGVSLGRLCSFAQTHSLSGLEFAWGIPGTVGGAVYMNAGAYGGEMKDVLESCTFLDESGQKQVLLSEQMELGYRSSIFSKQNALIEWAVFRLIPDDADAIKTRMQDYIGRRTSKQPLDFPSAGSVFKRPEGAFAGALIEQCGLKGYQIGGAQVSEKHAGFIINRGGATCQDVKDLVSYIQSMVEKQTGYQLECEIKQLF